MAGRHPVLCRYIKCDGVRQNPLRWRPVRLRCSSGRGGFSIAASSAVRRKVAWMGRVSLTFPEREDCRPLFLNAFRVRLICGLPAPFPLVFSNGRANDVTLFAAGSRPDLLPQCHKSRPESDDSRLGGWFNTGCFSVLARSTFGSEHRFGNQSTPAPVCIEILLLIWKRSSTRFRSSLLSIGEPTDAAPEKTYRLSRPFHRAH